MSYFGEYFWGEKNHGFEVLYHSVKQGPISTKELADFIRERTFAPLWEVFRVSSDKLALCHLELTRKLQDLIKDVLRYGEEQLKAQKKCKEEAVGTLDAVQVLAGVSQLLPKSRENYLNRCMDQERLRRESTSQKEMDKAETKTKKAAESLRRSVEKYNSARADFEQKMLDSALVHEEFKQNIENISVEMLLRKFAESKGTGQEKPAVKRLRGAKAFRLPGLSRREREPPAAVARTAEPSRFSSSDSDFDDEEPRKFYVHIKPAQARAPTCSPEAAAAQLRATAGSLILPPGPGALAVLASPPAPRLSLPRRPRTWRTPAWTHRPTRHPAPPRIPGFPARAPHRAHLPVGCRPQSRGGRSPCCHQTHHSPLHHPRVPGGQGGPGSPTPETSLQESILSPHAQQRGPVSFPEPLPTGLFSPQQHPRTAQLLIPGRTWYVGPLWVSVSPSLVRVCGLVTQWRPCRQRAGSGAWDRCSLGLSLVPSLPPPGVSRGPSPVVLGSQDALPVATAFTEYVHAYFRGHNPSCLARVTGELTMTFPAGIVRVFSGTPPPPVLSFRLVGCWRPLGRHLPRVGVIIPGLCSDPSQSDPETKDFWLNMAALTEALQRQAEQNPAASYYNVVLLRYQFSRPGAQSVPLQLSTHWQCGATLTQVSVEYSYRPGATAVPTPLTNVQILLPVGEPVTNVRLQPAATW
eukprot:bmy_02604T0